jgi:hypothetical protein
LIRVQQLRFQAAVTPQVGLRLLDRVYLRQSGAGAPRRKAPYRSGEREIKGDERASGA